MDKNSLVPRLEHLAYTVSFKEISSNLVLCQDHQPKNEQETVNYSSFLSTMATSEKLISFVRNRLDYHLVGLMSDKIRKKYVQQFYETSSELKENTIEPWAFLDCVLDESFKELETHASLPGSEPDSRLISTIAECSSELQKLKIDFRSMKNPTSIEKISLLFTSLSSLEHLTSLNLHQMRESHRSVLKLIGNSCPLLTHLNISGFCATSNDYFSLIFGDFADLLFPLIKEPNDGSEFPSSLELLQAPSEILTPMCLTLRHLHLSFGQEMFTDEFFSLATFVLRHLPSLEKMDGHHTSFGVEKFKNSIVSLNEAKIRKLNKRVEKERFESACKELVARRHPGIVFINRPTFSGFLSLVSLDYVYLDWDMVQSIPQFCPKLKEVRFFMPRFKILLQDPGFRRDVSSPSELQEHFKTWPKLETITFMNILPEYIKVILEAFASSLKRVTFSSCKKITLTDLMPCCQLESLSILGFSCLEKPEIAPARPPPNFLPQLKSFQSDYCPGLWSLWLEQISELTHLTLNCCHYGTKASVHPHCCSIPTIWPNLESFKLRRCAGLTVSMLSNFVRQLPKLKELSLPENVAKTDPKLAAKIWEDLSYQPSPVHLYFTNEHVYHGCSFVPVVLVEMTSSEESNKQETDSDTTADSDSDSDNY